MKKRSLSLLLVLVMVLSLLPVSALAQVYEVTSATETVEIRFQKDDGTAIGTQIVNGETDPSKPKIAEGAVYDPGCPLGDHEVFITWSFGGTTGDVEAIRQYVIDHWDSLKGAGKGLTVTAVTSPVRYLVYYDESDRVLKTVSAVAENGTDPKVAVDQDYVPATSGQDFVGWTTTKPIQGAESHADYQIGEEITLTNADSATSLYPVCKSGRWLSFDSNVDTETVGVDHTEASYTAPVFVADGETPVKPADPTRPGYAFKGWYKDAETTEAFDFSAEFTASQTVYAKWEAKGTVQYQVIFWKQNATDDPNASDAEKTYSYAADVSETRTAPAGSTVRITTEDTNLSKASSSKKITDGTSEKWNFFNYNANKTDTGAVIVNGDGSTVLNVYYDRQPITYNFWDGRNLMQSYVPVSTGATHYFYDDPYPSGYYLIGGDEGPYYYTQSTLPNGKYYYYAADQFRSESLTPGLKNNYRHFSTTNPRGDCTYPNDNNYTWFEGNLYRRARTMFDWSNKYMPVFYKYENQTGYYAVGTGPDRSAPATHALGRATFTGLYGADFNSWPYGNTFSTDNAVYPMPLRMFDNPDYGYAQEGQPSTLNFYLSSNESGVLVHYQGQTLEGGDNYEDLFTFYTGGGNWYPTEKIVGFTIKDWRQESEESEGTWTAITEDGTANLNSSNGNAFFRFTRNQHHFVLYSNNKNFVDDLVFYDAPLNKYGASDYEPSNGPAGSHFSGWYADPGYTEPFDFDITMPDTDMIVYAKWTPNKYRVELVLDGGTLPDTQQSASFVVDYMELIGGSAIESATKEGYQLVGWYLDTNPNTTTHFDSRFNFDLTKVTDDIADTTWREATDPAIRGKVTLYARWRQQMSGTEHIKVQYDAVNGTINGAPIYTSPLNYADQSQAIAQPASRSNVQRENFVEWEILGANDAVIAKVKPGDTFDVNLADTVPELDDQGTVTGNHILRLRAAYKAERSTHVTWVGNGGTTDGTASGAAYVKSDEAAMNVNIPIKPVDTFSYPNHIFLGWAKLNETDADGNRNAEVVDENGNYILQDLDEDDVWLKWENGKWYNQDGTEVLAIAANEDKPYHVLYAVWKEIEPVTYVVDFNAKMKLAENATIAADPAPVENNGSFTGGSGSTAFYQLNQITDTNKLTADSVNLAFNGVDTARITGRFYSETERSAATKSAALTTETKDVHVVPASSVYFADNLTSVETAIGDGSGYNAGVTASPATTQVNTATERTITFTGTGIDIYCTTDSASGWISANLYAGDAIVANGAHQNDSGDMVSPTDQLTALQSQVVKNNSVDTRNGCPTIRFTVPTAGTYTVRINTSEGSNYRFEGVRIYHPADASDSEAVVCYDADDQVPFTRVRDILISANTFNASGDADVSGAVFVENYTKPAQGQEHGKTTPENVTSVGTYKDYGPKGEVYLKPGQAIVFKVDRTTPLLIGMSSTDGTAVKYAVTKGTTTSGATISSTVDMYYEAQPDANGYVCIKNDGTSGLLAVTNVRAKDAKTEGGAISFSVGKDVLDYVAQFDQLLKSPWNEHAVSAPKLLSVLWQLLLQSFNQLFAGLDRW